MIAAVAIMAVACNKDQSAVRKLNGTWNATSIVQTIGGVSVEVLGSEDFGGITSSSFTFEDCKLKDDEFCSSTSTIVTPDGTFTTSMLYRTTDDGETLETKEEASSTTINSSEILDLSGNRLELRSVVEVPIIGTVTAVSIYEKQ